MFKDELGKLIKEHDIVVSYVPYYLHHHVYKQCLEHKKNLVHASYNKDFHIYDEEAKKSNLTFLGEMGVDPGIDHMSAL